MLPPIFGIAFAASDAARIPVIGIVPIHRPVSDTDCSNQRCMMKEIVASIEKIPPMKIASTVTQTA